MSKTREADNDEEEEECNAKSSTKPQNDACAYQSFCQSADRVAVTSNSKLSLASR